MLGCRTFGFYGTLRKLQNIDFRYSDFCFSKKSCDNRDNHIEQEAVSYFAKNLKCHFVSTLYPTFPHPISRVFQGSMVYGTGMSVQKAY
jgi:hypothetical protein